MISPERLRMYPFFGSIGHAQIEAIARIAAEASYARGELIFQARQPAAHLFLLESGCVDLFAESFDEVFKPELRRKFLIGEINPGEVFGISALIEPHVLTTSAIASTPSRAIKIDAAGLRGLAAADLALGLVLSQHSLQAVKERLEYTRVQLAAARQ